MLHRNKVPGDVHEGMWNGLGGRFEKGETPEECVLREVEEESGLILQDPRLRGVMTFPDFAHGQDEMVFLFTAGEFEGVMHGCDEGELVWVEDAKLFDLDLWPGDRIFMKWLDEPRFFSARFTYRGKELLEHSVRFYGNQQERK